MEIIYLAFQVIVSLLIFGIIFLIAYALKDRITHKVNFFLNPHDYLPEEEIKTLKQFYYLILILILFVSIVNFFFDNDIIMHNSPEFYVFNSVMDIIFSLYIGVNIYDGSKKSKILTVFLIPLASIAFLLFGESIIEYWDFIRIPALLYVMKLCYDKFRTFTSTHNLGKSILLLFSVIFLSFILTLFVEDKDPVNALVMVSNAFTSNGYAVLGESTIGKINSIFLVWSGYIISGAATATLTAAILIRHFSRRLNGFDKKFEDLENLIKELKDDS
ncbi:MAG: hypothetical protein IJH35_05710 [Methanobrevibacter sp.]|nr:hypothetical protein [Methanobrevibacter sp.]